MTVAADVSGVAVGDGLHGQADVTTLFTIGPSHVSVADDLTHQVSVHDGGVLRPGRPACSAWRGRWSWTPRPTGCPSTSPAATARPSLGEGIGTDGIYLHDLDSTVWAQGSRDTSHGCLDLDRDDASWFTGLSQVGDVVRVEHTGGAGLTVAQNGDRTLSAADGAAGSALH